MSLRQEGQCSKIFYQIFYSFMKVLQLNPRVNCLLISGFSQVAIFPDSPPMETLLTGETKELDKNQCWGSGSGAGPRSA